MRKMGCLVGLIAALALSTGCDDSDNVSFFIAGAVNATAEMEGSADCTLSVESPFLTHGLYNPEHPLSGPYNVFPVYRNQVRTRTTDLNSDPNAVYLTEAEVELLSADGSRLDTGGLPNPFTVPTTTFVPSASAADPEAAGQAVGD